MCYLILPSFIHNNSLKLIRIGYHVIVFKPITTDSDSFSSVRRRWFRSLQVTAMVLSSAKLCKSDFFSHKNKSFIKMLNRIGPSTDPCGTHETVVLKELDILLIFTLCFRCFK